MNCGRDPAFDDCSVGAVLLAHAVREACADGVRTYRLLQGSAEYKLRYASDVPCSETFLIGSGGLAEAVTAGLGRATFALPDPVRRGLGRIVR